MELKYLWEAFKLVWSNSKSWIFITLALTIVLGFLPIVTIILNKELINSVALYIINSTSGNLHVVLLLLFLQFFMVILNGLIQSLKSYWDRKNEIKISFLLRKRLLNKLNQYSMEYFGHPKVYEHFVRLRGNQANNFLTPITSLFTIVQGLISLSSFIVFLISVHWSLAVLSVIVAVPLFLLQLKIGNKEFWLTLYKSKLSRESNYIESILSNRSSIKEIRIFNLSSYLINKWTKSINKMNTESLKLLRKTLKINNSIEGATTLFYTLSVLIIVWLIKKSILGIGEFVAIGQTVNETQTSINQISNSLADVHKNNLFVKDFFLFIEADEVNSEELDGGGESNCFPVPLQKGIKVKNLKFTYPYGNNTVLKDLNFEIGAGEKVAIVGQNGSGKSTLIKCLSGLYKIQNGDILYDGKNSRDINQSNIRENVSIVFQDFNKYYFTVHENIEFGNFKKANDLQNDIEILAKRTGANEFIQMLPQKYDTYLGKVIESGSDLSGGQWQKLAITRALYKDSEIIVLDDPTSALDPLSELSLFLKL